MSIISISSVKNKIDVAKRGYLFVIIAAALTGLIHSLSKPLLAHSPSGIDLNPLTFAAIVYLINGVFFTPIKKDSEPIHKIGKRNLAIIAIIGVAEVSGLVAYFFGLRQTTAVNASILTNGETIFSVIIALTVFKERLGKRETLPFTAIITGIIIVPIVYQLIESNLTFTQVLSGNILVLLSGVFCAFDITLCKYVSGKVDPKRITQIVSFVGAAAVIVAMIAFQVPFQVDIRQIPAIVLLGLFGTGVATLLFLSGLKLIGTTRTVLLYSTNFAFGVVFAAAFLQETVTLTNIISIILASIGIIFLRGKVSSIEEHINPIQKQTKRGTFQTLCDSCKHHGCCTSFASPLLFPTDLKKLEEIGKASDKYIIDVKIQGKNIKEIRKKESSSECIFWDNTNEKCSIYQNRPFDCMIYPFDIFFIDGRYQWVVYSCNKDSNWEWSEAYLQMYEKNPQFYEILSNIETFSNRDKINELPNSNELSYTVIRPVNVKLVNSG